MAFSVVNFDTVNLCRTWVDHLVAATLEGTLCEDDFALELLAMMTKLEIVRLMTVLDL